MKKLLLMLIMSTASAAEQPPTARQAELRNLLKHDCGACHGVTLKGGLGSALLPVNLADKPDDFLVKTILEGRKGTAMPPWQQFISRDEAVWLVGILRNGVQ